MERDPHSRGHTPAGQSPERYVGRRELAEILGVSLATVDRMVADGMPSVTWGRRTRRFRPSTAVYGGLLGLGTPEGGMSIAKLPSGRWRAQVYDSLTGKNLSVSKIIGGPGTFATKTEAKRAREQARGQLREPRSREVTVAVFWECWTSDPLFARPKDSTNIHNRERTSAFVERYGTKRIDQSRR